MKVTKERNPYLRRISSDSPHKYSYEINTGKYMLLAEDGSERVINKTGTFKPKFRSNFSGFAHPKDRYQLAKQDDTALHFTPSSAYAKESSFYTPVTRKYEGYMQMPYKIKGRSIPSFLSHPDAPHSFSNNKGLRKSFSEIKKQQSQADAKNQSMILKNATMTFRDRIVSDQYFQTSISSMIGSKPLPKQAKKSCYNYRCKHRKHFNFEEREKSLASTGLYSNQNGQTLSKSFYEKQFEIEKKEFSIIPTAV